MIQQGLASLVCPLAVGNAGADPALRRGGALIEAGANTGQPTVLERCGAPDRKDGNRWVYENRPGQKTVIVHSEGRKVTSTEEVPG